MAALTDAITDFQYFNSKLFSEVSKLNYAQSFFLSPVSIVLAISMCAAGARNNTLDQMLQVLGTPSIEQVTRAAEKIMSIFALADQDEAIQLKLANRLYVQKDYQLRQDYLSLVQQSFQADIKLEDFVHHHDQAVQTINAWVKTQTNGLIRDLLTSDDVTSDTRLILLNCIYFKGVWMNVFQEHLTAQDANFYEENGGIAKIQLMHQTEIFPYYENQNLGVRVVHLPYERHSSNTQFVFTVILPDPNVSIAEVERKLTADAQLMGQVLNYQNARSKNIALYLPKFKMETKFQLNAVLDALGMSDAFYEFMADFTGMANTNAGNRLYIRQIKGSLLSDSPALMPF